MRSDGNAAPFWASLNSDFPGWIEQGKIRALVYYGATRDPEIPAPYAMDLITDPAKRSLLEVAQAGIAMGRPVLAPPGVESSAVDELIADRRAEAAREETRYQSKEPTPRALRG